MKVTIEGTAKGIAELLPALTQVKTRPVIHYQKQEGNKLDPETQIFNSLMAGVNGCWARRQSSWWQGTVRES